MKIVDMTATGDDNILSDEEKQNLEYRKAQLQKLQEEVCDMEDMTEGISIMDLGLNEFRLDLLYYVKEQGDLESTPFDLHAVVPATEENPEAYTLFNKDTRDGKNMKEYSGLLGDAISSIINVKDESDTDSFLSGGKVSFAKTTKSRALKNLN